jgi:hypothetical protein
LKGVSGEGWDVAAGWARIGGTGRVCPSCCRLLDQRERKGLSLLQHTLWGVGHVGNRTVLAPTALAQSLNAAHFEIEKDFQRPNPSLGMLVRRDVVLREGVRVKSSPTRPHGDPMDDHQSRSQNLELGSKEVPMRVAVGELSSRPIRCEVVGVFQSIISSGEVRTQKANQVFDACWFPNVHPILPSP